jgi:hypothetical protein
LLGADHDNSPYPQTGERIARIAAGGLRLVIEELRTDVTKTRKDGTRGRLRIDYGDPERVERDAHRRRPVTETPQDARHSAQRRPAAHHASRRRADRLVTQVLADA